LRTRRTWRPTRTWGGAPCGSWHRVGQQPVLPAAGTNRRVTVFGRVEALGRGRVEVVQARPDSEGFARYLAALDARHAATKRQVSLVLDNGSCHTSRVSQQGRAARAAWRAVIPLAKDSPELNPQEREWRTLKRDHRSHLATSLREFVDEIVTGLDQFGGDRRDIVDEVPEWWIAGHRQEPTGRPPGRPKGATDAAPRSRRTNLPAPT
jgi:hypothetical protein